MRIRTYAMRDLSYYRTAFRSEKLILRDIRVLMVAVGLRLGL